jgi:hypothetical protein
VGWPVSREQLGFAGGKNAILQICAKKTAGQAGAKAAPLQAAESLQAAASKKLSQAKPLHIKLLHARFPEKSCLTQKSCLTPKSQVTQSRHKKAVSPKAASKKPTQKSRLKKKQPIGLLKKIKKLPGRDSNLRPIG